MSSQTMTVRAKIAQNNTILEEATSAIKFSDDLDDGIETLKGERAELEGLILNAKTISVHLDTISGPSAISNAEAKENMETIQELYTVLEESEALLKEFTVFEAEHENEEVKIMEIEEAHVAEKSTQKSTDSFVPGTIE